MDNNVHKNDVLPINGDGGPDVLRLKAKLVDVLPEWCRGHWLNRLIIDDFGCSIDLANSKNIETRKIIEVVKKVRRKNQQK